MAVKYTREVTVKPLADRIAVVAGATRGVGRGIARMLGEAGATVYCTGRSVPGHPPAGGVYAGRPETIEETAALVTGHGGRGLAVPVDHDDAAAVAALADRLGHEHGRLDILVLDFWGDDAPVPFGTPFWSIPMEAGRRTIERTLWPHVLTLQALAPLMIERPATPALIVEVADGPALYYRASFFYDLAATLRIRLAYAAAEELAPRGVTVVAVSPGYVRTELTLARLGVTEDTWRQAGARNPDLLESETPCFLGRGIAALAGDPDAARWAGGLHGSWDLARAYGIRDLDGTTPDFGAHFRRVYGETPSPPHTQARWRIAHAPQHVGIEAQPARRKGGES
jgi:NAD(P)-dependent dehydrogenase (short-subunit alcohol dehydrogenase family)